VWEGWSKRDLDVRCSGATGLVQAVTCSWSLTTLEPRAEVLFSEQEIT
jgi:hypothetical protein